MNIEINPPVKVGEKIWMSKNNGFGTCNFLERYTQYEEVTVTKVSFEYDMETGQIKWTFAVSGRSCLYLYDEKKGFCFTKEQLFESFREEVETLIPEEMRNYLWK